VVVVSPGGDESGLVAVPLHLVEAQNVAVETERAVDVRHLEVDVPDVDARVDGALRLGRVVSDGFAH
jgi:hypothetical protein